MASKKFSLMGRGGLLLWLTGLTIVYQLMFHAVMWRSLPEETFHQEECVFNPEDPEDVASQSPRCVEVELFRTWHRGAMSDAEDQEFREHIGQSSAQEALRRLAVTSAVDATTPTPGAPTHAIVIAQREEVSWGHRDAEERDNFVAESAAPGIVVGKTRELSWGHQDIGNTQVDLLELIADAQTEMCQAPHRQHYSSCLELRANLDAKARKQRLEARLAAAVNQSKTLEGLAASVDSDQIRKKLKERKDAIEKSLAELSREHERWLRSFQRGSLEALQEMCAEPQRVNRTQCAEVLSAAKEAQRSEFISPGNITQDLEQRTAELEGRISASAAGHDAWQQEFQERALRAHKELCETPKRRGRSDCIEFLATLSRSAESAAEQDRATAASNKTWSETFMEAVRTAQREMCLEPRRRDRADCAEILASLPDSGAIAMTTAANATSEISASNAPALAADSAEWSLMFGKMIREAEREMCAEPHRRNRSDCLALLAAMPAAERRADAQQHLEDLRKQSASLEADMRKVEENHVAWEHDFEEEVRQVHREMCQDPRRRHRQDCEDFMAEDHQQSAPHGAALRASVAREEGEWEAKFQRRSVQRSAERDKWGREFLNRSGVWGGATKSSGSIPNPSLRQGRRQLQWSSLKEPKGGWFPSSVVGSKAMVEIKTATLRNSQWVGTAPKVACIASLPPGQAARVRMKELLQQYLQQTYMQSYEGPSQLVLVYHFQDEEAENLVRLHADGATVVGVAARGDAEEFPSTTALRYGAWSAAQDAQVIVHWDLEAKHSPERLSLQVRALAYGVRPGCLLQGVSWREGGSQDDTLAGETAWMWAHWYPHLKLLQDHAPPHRSPHDFDDRQVVVVDMDKP